jgi:hypothetical protein
VIELNLVQFPNGMGCWSNGQDALVENFTMISCQPLEQLDCPLIGLYGSRSRRAGLSPHSRMSDVPPSLLASFTVSEQALEWLLSHEYFPPPPTRGLAHKLQSSLGCLGVIRGGKEGE